MRFGTCVMPPVLAMLPAVVTVNGNPLRSTAIVLTCHPPKTPSANPGAFEPNLRPWPYGISYTPDMEKRWLTLRSESCFQEVRYHRSKGRRSSMVRDHV